MELRHYAATLFKWIWLVMLGTALAVVVAYIVTVNTKPVYEASAKILINIGATSSLAAPSYNDVLLSQSIANTYAVLIKTRPVLEEAVQKGNLGITPDALFGATAVLPQKNTQLINLRVKGQTAEESARRTNTVANAFVELYRQQQRSKVESSGLTLDTQIKALEDDIHQTEAQINGLKAGGQLAPERQAELNRLQDSLAAKVETLSVLSKNRSETKIAEARAFNDVSVVEAADAPASPVWPRPLATVALAAVAGLLVSVSVAFLLEYLDDTLKTPNDIANVSGVSTLGLITLFPYKSANSLPTVSDMHSAISEAYRTLRTNIQFAAVDRPPNTIVVTSAGQGEGKTTTAVNLAVVMAQAGKRVILVDADLRRPSVHRVFKVPSARGLTNLLLDNARLQDVLTDVTPGLRLLPCGPIPPNPSEILGSQRMDTVIDELVREAEIVLFDSPPLLAVTDAAVLSKRVDGTILVIESGRTRGPALTRAVEHLRQVGANVLGAVFNKITLRRGDAYYYYYYYYYRSDYSYGGDGSGKSGSNGSGDASVPALESVAAKSV